MIILMVAGLALAAGLCLAGAWRLHRRRRAAMLLEEDWWPGFEREFRAYAARCERRTPTRRRVPRRDPIATEVTGLMVPHGRRGPGPYGRR